MSAVVVVFGSEPFPAVCSTCTSCHIDSSAVLLEPAALTVGHFHPLPLLPFAAAVAGGAGIGAVQVFEQNHLLLEAAATQHAARPPAVADPGRVGQSGADAAQAAEVVEAGRLRPARQLDGGGGVVAHETLPGIRRGADEGKHIARHTCGMAGLRVVTCVKSFLEIMLGVCVFFFFNLMGTAAAAIKTNDIKITDDQLGLCKCL